MADKSFSSIDQLLSESFKRVAEPGDPTGVAELIRARVAGGDTGTPSNGSEFGAGGPGSGWPWLAWGGGAVAVAIVGGTLGATGGFGILAPPDAVNGPEALPPSLSISHSASGLDCPGGTPVVGFHPGDRVLAVARSADSSYLAVRSPFDRADTVWLPVSSLLLDEGQASIDSLEVDGCDEPVVTLLPASEPEPVEPTQPPAPRPPTPTTPPASDTTAPTLGTPSGVTQIGCTPGYGSKPDATTISIPANDNKAVTGVSITWSGLHSGSGQMSGSGSTWTYTYNAPDGSGMGGNVTFTMVAKDAAGNTSAAKQFTVNVECLG